MNWMEIGTFLISSFTLMTVILRLIMDYNNNKINREVEIKIKYRREKQEKLFRFVNILLDYSRKAVYSTISNKDENAIYEILDAKINIWINLNNDNKYRDQLREECVGLAFWLASYFENPANIDSSVGYLRTANQHEQKIWILIDKYIQDEERMDEQLIK